MRKNKMRILQVFEKVSHGGTEIMIRNLSMGLKELGHETALWTRQNSETIGNLDIMTSGECPWDYKPDLVLVHGGFWGTDKYFDMEEKYSVPIVEVIHRNVVVDGKATFYISPNTFIMKSNQEIGNIQHINNPVWFDEGYVDREKERLKYGIKKDDFLIARHARFDAEKSWPRFMWIMDRILKANKNVVCMICGEGDAKTTELLRKWAQGKRCIFKGWEDEPDTLLKISDAYLETSMGEAFGMSAVEAAMARLPIVLFDVPGLNELFGRSKYCVPDNNLIMCVEKVQELIDDKAKCLQEGKQNYEIVCNKFNVEMIAKEYVLCLEKICELCRLKEDFIKDNNFPVDFHNMLKQHFCKKFGISYCIRIYWLLYEWLYRMHTYSVDENVSFILQNINPNSAKKKGINVVDIDQVSELQVAKILKETSIFLSTRYPEGFGLPIAEALASGCKVIGYDGMGGRELFDQCDADSVKYGDIEDFVYKVVECIKVLNRNNNHSSKGKKDSDYILDYYSDEMQKRDLYKVY